MESEAHASTTKTTHNSSSLLSKISHRIIRKLRKHSKIPINYKYRNFSIKLPSHHLLPEYQKTHAKYDRFLPHLTRYIDDSETIVDIGANIGDSLAGMAEKNATAHYICIEADDSFYRHLEENVSRIKAFIPQLNVQTIKALVGKNISNVSLDGKDGTKHAVVHNDGGILSSPLDELIPEASSVRILKSDVDGFDYDVLDSSMAVIKKHNPMLFFECQYDYEYQRTGYAHTLNTLEAAGYCDWTVFDNFGEVVIRTSDLSIVSQLMTYIWQQNIGRSTRTIYYYDILAVQKNDSALIDNVLKDYN
ncbi:hypothetical protein PspS35_15610 [Pseudomonas sp. S35]|uniref:FkbM family methyltransferase n=1 Tax=Pseudomonas sp. S35 TaxID=1573719 RepID=UPI00132F09E2|nr:FkbM family methyltransferase [Pseudomonas sp. S35]QHF45138.1 hypothetical protein PspS35_15610 [Pseudomonas sp. S35]